MSAPVEHSDKEVVKRLSERPRCPRRGNPQAAGVSSRGCQAEKVGEGFWDPEQRDGDRASRWGASIARQPFGPAFCPEVASDARALRRLDRQLDRQRRANNPANYDERGRVKRGPKRWKVSKRQRKVQARRREAYRKLAATRKRSHGQLVHRVLALGNAFHLEQLSYRAWQKTYGKSVQLCAPGMFVERLSRLAARAGGTVVSINAWRARISQACHCGRSKKKVRSERWHVCPCGVSAQRDLFSAFLARFVHPETSLQGAGQAQATWPGWEPTRAAGV